MKTNFNIKVGITVLLLMFSGIVSFAQEKIVHIVKNGETLESIAAQYGVTVKDIKKSNPSAEKILFAGMKLEIAAPSEDSKAGNANASESDKKTFGEKLSNVASSLGSIGKSKKDKDNEVSDEESEKKTFGEKISNVTSSLGSIGKSKKDKDNEVSEEKSSKKTVSEKKSTAAVSSTPVSPAPIREVRQDKDYNVSDKENVENDYDAGIMDIEYISTTFKYAKYTSAVGFTVKIPVYTISENAYMSARLGYVIHITDDDSIPWSLKFGPDLVFNGIGSLSLSGSCMVDCCFVKVPTEFDSKGKVTKKKTETSWSMQLSPTGYFHIGESWGIYFGPVVSFSLEKVEGVENEAVWGFRTGLFF